MKKLIRLIIKVPATPFMVFFFGFSIIVLSIYHFFEWAYEASEFTKEVTRDCIKDSVVQLKKWFTTI